MSAHDDVKRFEHLAKQINPRSKLLRTWQLTGGVSAQVTGLEFALPDGRTQKWVVRQHGERDLARNPNIAADEFKLLQTLHAAGLPVPEPVHVEPSGKIFDSPCIVVAFVNGETEYAPTNLQDHLRQLAETLAQIHTIDLSKHDLSFLPQEDERIIRALQDVSEIPDETIQESLIRKLLASTLPLPALNKPALLHGDYWAGNVLWIDGKLLAVIDWEDAKIGDPIADLANTRLEILWAFGENAMRAFTHYYVSSMSALDLTHLPYWELLTALRKVPAIDTWGVDTATEQKMQERATWYVAQALEKFST